MFNEDLLNEFKEIPERFKPKYDNCKNAYLPLIFTPTWKYNIRGDVLIEFRQYLSNIDDYLINTNGQSLYPMDQIKEFKLFRIFRFWRLSYHADKTPQTPQTPQKQIIKRRRLRQPHQPHQPQQPQLITRRTNRYFAIEKFLCYKINYDRAFILVKWKNYPDCCSSWEPVEVLYADAPDLVEQFLNQFFMQY